jgi:hypothetical protein
VEIAWSGKDANLSQSRAQQGDCENRGEGAATNGLITYQLSDHHTSPRQSSGRQDKEDKEDKEDKKDKEDKARQGKHSSKQAS